MTKRSLIDQSESDAKKRAVNLYSKGSEGSVKLPISHKTNEQMLLEDAETRQHFVALQLNDGDMHVLHAGAGAGKTTLAIKLMKSVSERYPTAESIALTFNVAAAADGRAKAEGVERLTFKTIDSFLFALYSDDIKGSVKVDFNVTDEVISAVRKVLQMSISPEEARSLGDQLETSCNRGSCAGTGKVAQRMWDEGMKGTWWSHSMLRIRARDDPEKRWAAAMKKYKLIIVDEAQDMNLVMISLMRQVHHGATTVYIGDSAQSIYGFMQCVDVKHTLQQAYTDWTLYTTFRFGQRVCDWVNDKHLCVSPAVAHPQNVDTSIQEIDDVTQILPGPHTVLVRKWTEIMELADAYAKAGRAVYVDKEKVAEIQACAHSALPSTWDKRLFKKVPKLRVLDILDGINDKEPSESIVLSTVHGYKGLEADRVVVSRSVRNASNDDELKLLYVAVTRARKTLYLHKFRG
jgi:AAA domain/UvrD-like helicase C-terminal domain